MDQREEGVYVSIVPVGLDQRALYLIEHVGGNQQVDSIQVTREEAEHLLTELKSALDGTAG
jgi:hypothetical protein